MIPEVCTAIYEQLKEFILNIFSPNKTLQTYKQTMKRKKTRSLHLNLINIAVLC